MAGRVLAHLAAFVLALPAVGALAGPVLVPPPAGSTLPDSSDWLSSASEALSLWRQAAGGDSPATAMADLAEAALEFARRASREGTRPSEVLAAVQPLLESHAQAIQGLVPGYQPSTGQVERVELARRLLERLDANPHGLALEDALAVATGWAGEDTGALHVLAPHVLEGPGTQSPSISLGYPFDPSTNHVDDPHSRAPREANRRTLNLVAEPQPLGLALKPEDGLLAALKLQPRPDPMRAIPPTPHFDSLPHAVLALGAWHGQPIPTQLVVKFQALVQQDPQVAAALAQIIEAHLLQAQGTHIALADVRPVDGAPAPGRDVDLGLLAAARDAAAALVLDALSRLHPVNAAPLNGCLVGEVLALDLQGSDSTWECDTALLVDLGGNDTYTNNAGGASYHDKAYGEAALLVDVGGNDTYQVSRSLLDFDIQPGTVGGTGIIGGGCLGSGMLFDVSGNDTYDGAVAAGPFGRGAGGVNGGAYQGSGFLYDGAGDDSFLGTTWSDGGVNGGASTGMGFLYDAAGSDTYRGNVTVPPAGGQVRAGGVNGGASTGFGFLYDGAGNDTYDGVINQGGVNGGASTGFGFLYDGGGNDAYDGTLDVAGGVNGGANLGSGFLFDAAGNDVYGGSVQGSGGINGGANGGSGFLYDAAGDDVYKGTVSEFGGVNGATSQGIGLLHDAAGNDTYGGFASIGGVNGGAYLGVALLVDAGGTNNFTASRANIGGTNGGAGGWSLFLDEDLVPTSLPGGVGILMGGPGDDRYFGADTTQGAGDLYGVGILIDPGGENTYVAGPRGLAQGAAARGGLGLLLDRGTTSTFELLSEVTGQGAGIQAVGLLLRPDVDASAIFLAGRDSEPQRTTGAGAGFRLDRGLVTLLGEVPDPLCSNSKELRSVPLGGFTLRVCAPDPSTNECLVDPTTGRPLRDPFTHEPCQASKPPVPCSSLQTGGVGCDSLLDEVLGPGASPWLERAYVQTSTSGGFTLMPTKAGTPVGKYVTTSADDACEPMCPSINQL